jgi:hypothetical protein
VALECHRNYRVREWPKTRSFGLFSTSLNRNSRIVSSGFPNDTCLLRLKLERECLPLRAPPQRLKARFNLIGFETSEELAERMQTRRMAKSINDRSQLKTKLPGPLTRLKVMIRFHSATQSERSRHSGNVFCRWDICGKASSNGKPGDGEDRPKSRIAV